MRIHATSSTPDVRLHADTVLWSIPMVAVVELVKVIGQTLRDDDDMAADLLKAGSEPAWSQAASDGAVAAIIRARLAGVEIAYPVTSATTTDDDEAVVYRLCSTCHRLRPDCVPGLPTVCGSCQGGVTA